MSNYKSKERILVEEIIVRNLDFTGEILTVLDRLTELKNNYVSKYQKLEVIVEYSHNEYDTDIYKLWGVRLENDEEFSRRQNRLKAEKEEKKQRKKIEEDYDRAEYEK